MRILLVSQEYPPETAHGGIGTQTYAKAKGLSNLGHEIFVLSHSIDGMRHEKYVKGITVIRIPGMETMLADQTLPVHWVTYSSLVAAEIEHLKKRIDIDIIDFPDYGGEGFIYLLNRTEWNRIPTIIHLHGSLVMLANTLNWPEKESEFFKTGTFMESTCYRLADKVYSSSRCSADWCQKHYFKRNDNIPVIHTGIDTDLFSPKKNEKHAYPTILFVGRIAETKGIVNLVEVACNLSKNIPNLKLRMIGNGETKLIKELKAKASSNNTPELLEFAGFQDKEKITEEFSRAHVFAAPSYYEGGPGFVYLEAMSCGLPVIGCSGSGVEEIIESGKNGLLVPPNNNPALEKAINKLFTDSDFAKNMGKTGREYVLNHANKNACIKEIEKLYYSVIN